MSGSWFPVPKEGNRGTSSKQVRELVGTTGNQWVSKRKKGNTSAHRSFGVPGGVDSGGCPPPGDWLPTVPRKCGQVRLKCR